MTVTQDAPATPSLIRRRPLLTSTLGLLVVAIVLVHQLWWSQPAAYGGGISSSMTGTFTVGRTMNVNMYGPGEAVRLHHVTPVTIENSADADIDFVVCHWKGDTQLGAGYGSLDRYCSTVIPVDGATIAAPVGNESIIARITPRRAGRITLDGIDVNYSRDWRHLWQTGSERSGIRIDSPAS